MSSTPVAREQIGSVAVLTLQRPDQLNALDVATITALDAIASDLDADATTRVVVITGAGKAFCAGADIKEFGELSTASQFSGFIRSLERVLRRIELLGQPVIAALNGIALGGGLELAMACDLRVAAEHARLGVPEIKLGLLPGAGGTQRLPRLVPPGFATRMLLVGDPIDATEGHRIGLIDEVVPNGTALEAAVALAEVRASRPPLALAAAKRLLADGRHLPLDAALELERATVAGLFASQDRVEGIAAFVAKRSPRFSGR
jgi:enoyl-CoA hydratase